jgi:cytoskeletal protein RodZ
MATTTTGELIQLPQESRPWTHLARITHAELTDPTNASVQTIAYAIPANSRIEDVAMDVRVPLSQAADATFDDITASVKDNAGTPIVFIAAKAVAGSPVLFSAMDKAAVAGQVYTAAAVLNIAFTPETGKKLVDLDAGQVNVYLNLQKRGTLG